MASLAEIPSPRPTKKLDGLPPQLRVVVMTLDEQLLAVGSGSRAAFRALFDAYGGTAMGIALRILRDREAAEDAVQEAFLRLWRLAGNFDPERGVAKAWLSVIVRNTALDQVRGRRPMAALDDIEAGLMSVEQPSPPDNRLRQCMERLPLDQAHAITTMYAYGMSHSELADHLCQPLGTVKSWVRRGTDSLRHCMDAHGGATCPVDISSTPRRVDA
ncbi:MAG: sigma-70 family RNA polymerase sigma factor [Sphingopyxis sp.]